MINRLIKFLVTWKWKKERFYTWSWGVDEHTDIYIITEESFSDRHRYGTLEEKYNAKHEYIKEENNEN